jgi:hypothetical protein
MLAQTNLLQKISLKLCLSVMEHVMFLAGPEVCDFKVMIICVFK